MRLEARPPHVGMGGSRNGGCGATTRLLRIAVRCCLWLGRGSQSNIVRARLLVGRLGPRLAAGFEVADSGPHDADGAQHTPPPARDPRSASRVRDRRALGTRAQFPTSLPARRSRRAWCSRTPAGPPSACRCSPSRRHVARELEHVDDGRVRATRGRRATAPQAVVVVHAARVGVEEHVEVALVLLRPRPALLDAISEAGRTRAANFSSTASRRARGSSPSRRRSNAAARASAGSRTNLRASTRTRTSRAVVGAERAPVGRGREVLLEPRDEGLVEARLVARVGRVVDVPAQHAQPPAVRELGRRLVAAVRRIERVEWVLNLGELGRRSSRRLRASRWRARRPGCARRPAAWRAPSTMAQPLDEAFGQLRPAAARPSSSSRVAASAPAASCAWRRNLARYCHACRAPGR